MRSGVRACALALVAPVALAALAACAPLPTRHASGPIADIAPDVAPVSAAALSPVYATEAARVDAAERIWRLIAERFYDPALNGVDWQRVRSRTLARVAAAASDAEFYRALKDMAAALGDSHTVVLTPREALDRRRYASTRIGVHLAFVEGRVAVAEVEADSPAAHAGIAPGDVILSTNGVRFDEQFVRAALADPRFLHSDVAAGDGPQALPADARDAERVRVMRAVRRALRPAPMQPDGALVFEFERADGARLRTSLAPVSYARPPRAELRWLPGEVALIRLTRFAPELHAELDQALDEAARASALIVDLRGNSGGLLEMFRWFAGAFLPEDRFALRSLRRERGNARAQQVSYLRVGPPRGAARAPLTQPLAVLIDGRSASAAELTAVTLAEQRGALLVGEPSCGCVVGVRFEYVLPDGGGVRIAETGFLSAQGLRLEGVPLTPAVRVTPTLADLRSGRDAALEEAHRLLRAGARTAVGTLPVAAEAP
jgi:C-terminal processing protease CtpA/Prc